ncbi:Gastrula zinc finger, partial [Paramuricea clavata]
MNGLFIERRSLFVINASASFTRKDDLKRHQKRHQGITTHTCENCRKKFYRRDNLVEHQVQCQGNPLKRGRDEDDSSRAPKKVRVENQIGEGEPDNQVEENNNPCSSTTAFEDSLKKIELKPRKDQKQDMSRFLRGKTRPILTHLSNELVEKRGIKWFISVKVRFIKPKPDGEDLSTEPHFRSLCMKTVNQHELDNQLDEAKQKITQSLVLFQKEGSGWVLDKILHLDLSIAQYTPVRGSSYIPLPNKLKTKKAIINIRNSDNKCFMWSILAALHPIPYSFKINLIAAGTTRHYCLIKDLNKFLYSQNRKKARMFYCRYCLHGFIREDLLQDHEPHCSQHGPQRIELPDEDNATLFYKDYHKQLKVPFAIYADFESLTTKIDSTQPNPEKSFTEKYQHHQPCGFSYIVVSDYEKYSKPPVVYRGEDAVDKFLECLEEEQKYIQKKVDFVEPMRIERDEEQAFQDAVNCHICGYELGADRVRDHCHLTGKFRGAAHNDCNLNYSFTGRIPVILHNLRGYDSHLIMQGLGKLKDKKINCIPNNTEKYISFSIDNLDFIDSLQFMNASLEKLVSNLAKDGDNMFPTLKKYIDSDKVPLLLRKGVYPYDHMNCVERFEESTLPPKESFYNVLNDEQVSDEDYAHATTVFNRFACQNMGDYHDLYLMSDVLLLADVFENFRSVCLKAYNLDPCHFYTSPGLAWQACLKMTGVELELLTNPDMYLFIEEGLRGGISMISNRFSKANNPYVPDYDPKQENSYVMYFDANNLYGWAMSQPLPTGEFDWLTDQEIAELDITDVADDNEQGYVLEVDLHYPSELHDLHNDYPLAPERMKVSSEMLSPYCQELSECLNLRGGAVPKLVPNLRDKTNYVVHYRNLKQYLAL